MAIVSDFATFQIGYAGDALESGVMDVRDLAPALLGLADLVEEASSELLGRSTAVQLNVKATAKGSFIVELQLLLDVIDGAIEFFTSDGYKAAGEALKLLGIGSGVAGVTTAGLLRLKKVLAGRPIKSVTPIDSSSEPVQAMQSVRIELHDGTVVEAFRGALTIAQKPRVQEATEKLVEPLRRPGVDRMYIGRDVSSEPGRADGLEIDRKDALTMSGSLQEAFSETLSDSVSENRVLSIVTPSFKQGVMWRVSDGQNSFLVHMLDESFVDDVSEGRRSLNARDTLRVALRTHSYRTDSGLHTDYEVLRVIEHIPPRPSTQISLDF